MNGFGSNWHKHSHLLYILSFIPDVVGLDLPEEIPMPMVIGTKVTAKVHPEGDGLNLFTGTVDAVDNVNNAYRINFDR